jgi:hypothetical protein
MAASARSLEELWATYGVVLGVTDDRLPNDNEPPDEIGLSGRFQDEGVPCAWLRKQLGGAPEQSPLLTELLWHKLVRCPGPETIALFARQDAPLRRVLENDTLYEGPGLTPALEAAARRILDQNVQELYPRALDLMSANPGPVGLKLREELWRRVSDEVRAEREQMAANSERFEREHQAHPTNCTSIPVQSEGVSEEKILLCLDKWAASNWAASARFAQSDSRPPSPTGISQQLATLRNFESLEAMRAWARQRKLLPEGALPVVGDDPPGLSLIGSMRQAQSAFSVELRSEEFPRRHDELLVTLAWKVRPELSGVVFEQLAPNNPPAELFQPPSHEEYTLRAYADGQRFSVQARFGVMDTTGTEGTVVFGLETALREADALGLWHLGGDREMLSRQEHELEASLRRILGEPPY